MAIKYCRGFAQLANEISETEQRCKSVYAAQNECQMTGLEKLIHQVTTPEGPHIKLFKDHKGNHRIVAFKTDAHRVGYSGVFVQSDGEIHYKETCKSMRGHNTTRHLQAMLTAWGVHWYRYQYLTKAGGRLVTNE